MKQCEFNLHIVLSPLNYWANVGELDNPRGKTNTEMSKVWFTWQNYFILFRKLTRM